MEAEKANHSLSVMCRVLGVSRSGFYAWRNRPRVTPKMKSNRALLGKIRAIHSRSRKTYGSPRVHRQLRRDDIRVGRNRVARLMREDALRGRIRRRFRSTTDSNHSLPVAPNTLNREFWPSRRTMCGPETSPTSALETAGATWPSSSISIRGWSWAGPSLATCARNWSRTH